MGNDNNSSKLNKVILWIARIWGIVIILFTLFILLSNIFGGDESGEGFRSTPELISFICFPISTLIGLGIGLKKEGLGGIITVTGMILFFIVRPDLILSYLWLVFFPGILFLLYWYLERR